LTLSQSVVDTGGWVGARYGACCWCPLSAPSSGCCPWSVGLVTWCLWTKNELDQSSRRRCQCKVCRQLFTYL